MAASGGIAGDRLGGLQRLVEQLGGRDHARDQARALGFLGVHHPAGEAHFHRLGLADRAGQPLRAAHAGRHAELDLGLAELGVSAAMMKSAIIATSQPPPSAKPLTAAIHGLRVG
jgi:hypothetical protein